MSKKDVKKPGKQQAEKKPEEKSKVNFEELIYNNLSNFQMVYDYSGFHFTDLNLSNKNLEGLSQTFNNYKYTQTIDLSCNNIIDFNLLSNMPFLIKLNLEQNSIKDMKPLANEESFKNLKVPQLSKYTKLNKIVDLGPIKIPNLVELNLTDNRLEKFEAFDGHPKLRKLELRRNKVSAFSIFQNLPELKELYLAENKIKTVQGLEQITNIQILHLRKNNIEVFDETFPQMESLQYLNLRENKIEKYEEIMKLQPLPQLKTLIISGNNVTVKSPNYLLDTVNNFLKLGRLNKIHVMNKFTNSQYQYRQQRI